MTNKPTIKDSLLLCASDLQHSAIYDNHIEMQSCIRAVADRITALASVIDGVGRAALAAPAQATVAPTHQQIADYLTASGAWVTNEATRDAATSEEGNVEALGMNQSRRFDTPLYATPQLPVQGQEEAVAQAVAAEREACAQLAAQTVCDMHIPTGVKIYGARAAKAIRARGTDAAKPAAQAQEDAMDSAMEYEPDQSESMPLTKDKIVRMAIEANPWGIDGRLTEIAFSAPPTLLRFVALVTAAERRACTAACEKVKQQAKATANSSFVTDAGKDVHNAMAAGAQNCIAAIAERVQHAS